MDPGGIEPPNLPCHGSVLPVYHGPLFSPPLGGVRGDLKLYYKNTMLLNPSPPPFKKGGANAEMTRYFLPLHSIKFFSFGQIRKVPHETFSENYFIRIPPPLDLPRPELTLSLGGLRQGNL